MSDMISPKNMFSDTLQNINSSLKLNLISSMYIKNVFFKNILLRLNKKGGTIRNDHGRRHSQLMREPELDFATVVKIRLSVGIKNWAIKQ